MYLWVCWQALIVKVEGLLGNSSNELKTTRASYPGHKIRYTLFCPEVMFCSTMFGAIVESRICLSSAETTRRRVSLSELALQRLEKCLDQKVILQAFAELNPAVMP